MTNLPPFPARQKQIESSLIPLRTKLLEHDVYQKLHSLQALQTFMQHHVFAVWDFMSLLKSLQQRICCNRLPWVPPIDRDACRLINEIVLGEESDIDRSGKPASHFDLYLQSMRTCQADTKWIEQTLGLVSRDVPVQEAMQTAGIPDSIRSFVEFTFSTIERGETFEIASAFTFGREDLLPRVFQRIVEQLDQSHAGILTEFRYYLDRHIQLDGEEHGPMANQLIANLCGEDPEKWDRVERVAVKSLEQRLILWDGILAALNQR